MKRHETWSVKRVFSPRSPTGIYEVRTDDGRLILATPSRHVAFRVAAAPELEDIAKLTRDLLSGLQPLMRLIDEAAATKYGPGIDSINSTIALVLQKASGAGEWDDRSPSILPKEKP